jgi:phage terminase large subunit-like protein
VNWPREYLAAIRRGDIVASVNIRAVYERECGWMESPPPDFPFYFDEDAGKRPIDFIETYCRHSKGKWAGKPFLLELFQKAKLQLAYGWKEKETGMRRFREVVDIRARKNGKSAETAAVELFSLIADGEGGAEIYACANKLDQSKLVFNEAVNMRAQSEAIRSVTKKRQSDIYFPATFSTLKALAADTKTMDGLNAHFFSQDEFHEARDSKIYDVMIQSQAAREQPLAWLISTNGFVREAFFDAKYDYCAKVALWEGGFEDYRTLPLIYELDNRDEWTDPTCWEKANPGLGKIKSIDTLAENVEKAKRDPSFLPTLLTKDFNIPENSNAAWLTYEAAVNETVVPMEYLQHSYAIGFTDLSATTDLTAAGVLIRKPNDENIYVLVKCFLPQSRVDRVESSNAREAPYKLWAQQGWLHICDGASVNYQDVTDWFVELVNVHDIRPLWVCYDAALSGYWAPSMVEYGFDMEKIRQGPFSWSYSMKQLGAALEEHKVVYQNNPMVRWALLNTAKKSSNSDGIETIQPVKTGKSKRIDPMVAMLNGWVGYNNHFDEYMRYLR